jgi:hypothetical protein
VFPLGSTTVACSAEDTAGNTSTSSFDVLVLDTTSPIVSVPGGVTVPATGPGGALVSFAATATDAVDGSTPADCTPPSGSLFPAGPNGLTGAVTTVTCGATDANGNGADPATFDVTVLGAFDQLGSLTDDVRTSTIASTPKRVLVATLRTARSWLARGKPALACLTLEVFVLEVRVYELAGLIPTSLASEWVGSARRIEDVIGS